MDIIEEIKSAGKLNAIVFAEWLAVRGYKASTLKKGEWFKFPIKDKVEYFTTEQLHNQYEP